MQPKKPVPMEDISNCVNQLISMVANNGANSVSMPDEYVSVAHFISFPEQYYLETDDAR